MNYAIERIFYLKRDDYPLNTPITIMIPFGAQRNRVTSHARSIKVILTKYLGNEPSNINHWRERNPHAYMGIELKNAPIQGGKTRRRHRKRSTRRR